MIQKVVVEWEEAGRVGRESAIGTFAGPNVICNTLSSGGRSVRGS